MPAPESVAVTDPALAAAAARPRRGESLVRRSTRAARGLLGAGGRDGGGDDRVAEELRLPVASGRQIVVTSIRGGAGKTTVTALLSRTFNHYRHDPVVTVEADAALGTLPVRLGAETVRWSCADLAAILDPAAMQLTDITGYLVPLEGGWLLPGSQGRIGAPLTVPAYRTVMVALRCHFGVTVVDCESLPGEVARTAVDTAHARVLVAPATLEGVSSTRAVLDWMAGLPRPVLASTVIALTVSSPDAAFGVKAATRHLEETGVPVVVVPYDRHLAAGGPVLTSLLAPDTRAGAIRLATEALHRAAGVRTR
ncbi:MinD/ParA family ATP-binding protein [Streptomyces paludis]|uniref:Type VII secretion protein n=1 Tax=Streptomyces paludis TaxID=2282738 RepID=A0A345HK22_9ACTN|nr:type VII secretion protein [Streptomyces paludis]AXG77046.1 type VII secretion protein [Streptomyces paludis]